MEGEQSYGNMELGWQGRGSSPNVKWRPFRGCICWLSLKDLNVRLCLEGMKAQPTEKKERTARKLKSNSLRGLGSEREVHDRDFLSRSICILSPPLTLNFHLKRALAVFILEESRYGQFYS